MGEEGYAGISSPPSAGEDVEGRGGEAIVGVGEVSGRCLAAAVVGGGGGVGWVRELSGVLRRGLDGMALAATNASETVGR